MSSEFWGQLFGFEDNFSRKTKYIAEYQSPYRFEQSGTPLRGVFDFRITGRYKD